MKTRGPAGPKIFWWKSSTAMPNGSLTVHSCCLLHVLICQFDSCWLSTDWTHYTSKHRDSSYILMSLKHWCISEQMHMFVSSGAWTHLAWHNGLVFPDKYYTYILVRLVLTCTVTASAHPYCTKDHHFASGSKSFYHHTLFLKFLLFKKNISIFDTPQNWCLEVRILTIFIFDCSFL